MFTAKPFTLILAVLISLSLTACSVQPRPSPWEVEQEGLVFKYSNLPIPIAFSPDGANLIMGCESNQIHIWNIQTSKIAQTLSSPNPYMQPLIDGSSLIYTYPQIAVSPDGKTVVGVGIDAQRKILVWDAETGKLLRSLAGHESGWQLMETAFSPDGRILVTAHADILLWNTQTWDSLGPLVALERNKRTPVFSLAFSPDSKILAVGSFRRELPNTRVTGPIFLWDVSTRKFLRVMEKHEGVVEALAFSPDGSSLASAGWDAKIRFWNVQTGEQLRVFADDEAPILSIAFSPDARLLASGSWDGVVRLWDVETGVVLRKMRSGLWFYKGNVHSVVFSPDGETLAAGLVGGRAIIWNVKTGKKLRVFHNPGEMVNRQVQQ